MGEQKRGSVSALSTAPLGITLVARTTWVDGRMYAINPARWNIVLRTCPRNIKEAGF